MKLQSVDGTIRVQSSNIELGAALTQHCRENIEKTASKLFGRINDADVHFRREGAMAACSIRIKVGALNPWAAEISHHNPYRAFNNALRKVTEQMRRAKSALREDHGRRLDQNLGIARPVDAIPRF
ncbi:MAG: 30S ribosomal protein S30 [Oxalobacteraceae bacterium]|nr:MAG: 30S ribosomal protein S30 [Oxalobacteraceae bacterium]